MDDYFFVLGAPLCFLHAECVYAEAWVLLVKEQKGVVSFVMNIGKHERKVSV